MVLHNLENIEKLKKELDLDFATDSEIFELALKCSQEIKCDLINKKNKVGVYEIVNALHKADEVILKHLLLRK